MTQKFCRVWIESKNAIVQSYAIPNTVNLSPTELSMTFRVNDKCPELVAIAHGNDYVVAENSVVKEVLTCKPKNRVGRLKTLGGNKDFKIHDIDSAIAWYLLEESGQSKHEAEAKGLEIVVKSEVKNEDQIAISQDGRIYVSENVNDKLVKIKCEIIIPRQVIHLPFSLSEIKAHLVYEEDEHIKYTAITGKVKFENSKGGGVNLKEKQTVKMSVDSQDTVILLD